MEDFKFNRKEQEITFSKTVKAGKRMYYLDVKKSKNNDLFLSITESKKKFNGDENDMQFSYEKHKIFLYKEDFEKFADAFNEVIEYINIENTKNGAQDIRTYRGNGGYEYKDNYTERADAAATEVVEEDTEKKYDVDMDFEI